MAEAGFWRRRGAERERREPGEFDVGWRMAMTNGRRKLGAVCETCSGVLFIHKYTKRRVAVFLAAAGEKFRNLFPGVPEGAGRARGPGDRGFQGIGRIEVGRETGTLITADLRSSGCVRISGD